MTQHGPRIGLLGTGWIGRLRMKALLDAAVADVVAICDPEDAAASAALELAPSARRCESYGELLEQPLDGLVIATPSASHASQSIAALECGLAVFCQKPLGRTAPETAAVIDSARAADRRLGVDFCYRHTRSLAAVNDVITSGELGHVFAAELVFHNAYGPDKPWFYQRQQSGGGCVIDLGIHLVDAALWCLDFPGVEQVSSRLFRAGERLPPGSSSVEDYATARLDVRGGTEVLLRCSWNLPAGQEAIIGATFYGTRGGAALRNVGGSFFDFTSEVYDGTRTQTLETPPDDWGGRALVAWTRALGQDRSFDPQVREILEVARVIDRIYGDVGWVSDQPRTGPALSSL